METEPSSPFLFAPDNMLDKPTILCYFILQSSPATLAQLVEQLTRNEQVVGSIPTGGSKKYRG
jgi:hypothetical protein